MLRTPMASSICSPVNITVALYGNMVFGISIEDLTQLNANLSFVKDGLQVEGNTVFIKGKKALFYQGSGRETIDFKENENWRIGIKIFGYHIGPTQMIFPNWAIICASLVI